MKALALIFSFLACLKILQPSYAESLPYQNGDLIFQESQSDQSKAIRESTNSRWSHVGILFSEQGKWFVAEAIQPVTVTPLRAFLARGKNREYRIYRVPGLTENQQRDLRREVRSYLGQNYDIYFEWSDDLIYCSELVYKTFLKVTGLEVGRIQRFRDLRLDGPYARELIRRRIEDTGRTLNLDEPIVTPASQILDSKLVMVERSDETRQ